MGTRFKNLVGIVGLSLSSIGVATAILATAAPSNAQSRQPNSIADEFNEAFFQNSGDYYQNRTIFRQIDFILGQGRLYRNSFPELEIDRDGKRIEQLYREVLSQQVSSGPILRTPDMPNPYDTSLLQLPPTNFNRYPGSELNFESFPQP